MNELVHDNAWEMFFPRANRRRALMRQTGKKFVHYTSAEVALSIIKNEEVWMRNSALMNDFNEINHGFECVNYGLKSKAGVSVLRLVENVHPGLFEEILNLMNGLIPIIRSDTYLVCLSEHEENENRDGRLSMWRAYAPKNGVALVLNNEPFLRPSDGFNAYTSPVEYSDIGDFELYFVELYNSLSTNSALFERLEKDSIKNSLISAFRFAVCSTKHPGFREEQEWRVIYNVEKSDVIQEAIYSINSVPQVVQKIPLKNNREADIYGITLDDLIYKIIIGPSQFPNEIRRALGEALKIRNVTDPFGRISTSNIPIRN